MKVLNSVPKQHWLYAGAGLALLLIGGLAGWYICTVQTVPVTENIREQSDEYTFINPLLFVKIPETTDPKYSGIKRAITMYANSREVTEKARDVSIYYRDLDNSQWVGINEDETFSAASMLKVATLISVVRAAEHNPSLLTTSVLVVPGSTTDKRTQDYYPPAHPVTAGQTYTVQELLNHLIIESDNTANNVLYQLIDKSVIANTYTDLEIPTRSSNEEEVNTARDYSHLFRVLYNGTYLSKDLSESVLELLSKTTFVDGLVAGVPTGTVVSHKFGQRNLTSAEDSSASARALRELHDCGIVYYPGHPYFICVMTKGSEYAELAAVVQGASRVVWNTVDALYKK